MGFLMRYMATYPVRKLKPREAESPQAPLSDGCRLTLECLKLGPPADGQCFSEQTGALSISFRLLMRQLCVTTPSCRVWYGLEHVAARRPP